jgi:adhesin transport system outer membrane protein
MAASAACLVPLATASAADGAATASDDAGPRPEWREPSKDRGVLDPPAPVPVMAAPAASGPPAGGEPVLYGPPAPKSEKGRLPEIAWPEAPDAIPPALEQAVRITTRNYPSASSARSSLRAAAADVRAAKWLHFPSVSANIAYLDSSNSPQPQVVVDLPMWSGGRIEAGIKRAKAGEDVSSARYVETVETLALTVSQTYYQIANLTQREKLLADSLKEHLRLVATMERRVKQEVSPQADLELARSRSAQIEQDYTITRSNRQTALRIMAEFVADPSYDLGPVPFFDPKIELPSRDTLEDEAVAFDPQISRLRAEADVARAEYDATRASIFPQLSAQYSYDDVFKSRFGLALKAQTSGGLSQFSQAEGAKLRVDAALENARVAEQELRRNVATDVIEYDSARRRASISRNASETASNVSASYMRQFIAGRRSWLDVMNALREAVNAQIGLTDSEIGAMSAASRLLLRSGRWRPEFPKSVPAQP